MLLCWRQRKNQEEIGDGGEMVGTGQECLGKGHVTSSPTSLAASWHARMRSIMGKLQAWRHH